MTVRLPLTGKIVRREEEYNYSWKIAAVSNKGLNGPVYIRLIRILLQSLAKL